MVDVGEANKAETKPANASRKPEIYTYFGAVLNDLIASRGHSQSSFAKACRELGYPRVHQSRISQWSRLPTDNEGNAASLKTRGFADAWFGPVADEVLGFDDEELVRFALAFTYGQQIPRDRRLREEEPPAEAERREPTEPADISEEGLKRIAQARRYYRYVVGSEGGHSPTGEEEEDCSTQEGEVQRGVQRENSGSGSSISRRR